MVDVARLGTGVDLLEIAALLALGERIASALSEPRFQQPLAVRFLTAQPGPLPTGRVRSVGTLDRVLAFPGVVQAEVYLEVRPSNAGALGLYRKLGFREVGRRKAYYSDNGEDALVLRHDLTLAPDTRPAAEGQGT